MWTFRAMNTDVSVSAPTLSDADEQRAACDVARVFAETERRFSRFRPDSELSDLNCAMEPVVVSPQMLELLLAAAAHAAETDGLFDATIETALVAAGYDRTFTPGGLDRDAPPARAAAPVGSVVIDVPSRRVTRPLGLRFDFGGFLKGRTVDEAAALVPVPAAVEAGGDAMLRGDGPGGDGWLVDVEDPEDARVTLVTLRVRDRAVATSAPNRHRWRAGDQLAHHLIDPRTRTPSRSDLAQVTILAPSAERADVMAKAVFLLGEVNGAQLLTRHRDLGAVLVTGTGEVRILGDIEVVHA
jgi:FAD:protein FMN transferase